MTVCERNHLVMSKFPLQRTSNAVNVSIAWRYYLIGVTRRLMVEEWSLSHWPLEDLNTILNK